MRCRTLYAIGTLVVAVSGCASMQIQTDYDPAANFSGYRTYSWMLDVTTVNRYYGYRWTRGGVVARGVLSAQL